MNADGELLDAVHELQAGVERLRQQLLAATPADAGADDQAGASTYAERQRQRYNVALVKAGKKPLPARAPQAPRVQRKPVPARFSERRPAVESAESRQLRARLTARYEAQLAKDNGR